MSKQLSVAIVTAVGLMLGAATRSEAQQTAPHAGHAAPVTAPALAVGMMAPDFELRGATRYGVLEKPVHLADMRGETVVIAFFYRARTKG